VNALPRLQITALESPTLATGRDVPAPSQLYKLLTQQYFADRSIFPCKLEYPKLSIDNSLELPQLVLASLPLP
jgi:hypothetical protein